MFCSELTTLLDGLKYLEVVGLDSTIKSCEIFQKHYAGGFLDEPHFSKLPAEIAQISV